MCLWRCQELREGEQTQGEVTGRHRHSDGAVRRERKSRALAELGEGKCFRCDAAGLGDACWDPSPGSFWEKAKSFTLTRPHWSGWGFENFPWWLQMGQAGVLAPGTGTSGREAVTVPMAWEHWSLKMSPQAAARSPCSAHGGTWVCWCLRKLSSSDLPPSCGAWNPGARTLHGVSPAVPPGS